MSGCVCWLQPCSVSSGDEDDDVTAAAAADIEMSFSWRRLYDRVRLMLCGHSDVLPRTTSLVQVLGNMTVTFPCHSVSPPDDVIFTLVHCSVRYFARHIRIFMEEKCADSEIESKTA